MALRDGIGVYDVARNMGTSVGTGDAEADGNDIGRQAQGHAHAEREVAGLGTFPLTVMLPRLG